MMLAGIPLVSCPYQRKDNFRERSHKGGEDSRQGELLQPSETGLVVTATESAAEQQLPVTISIQLVVDRPYSGRCHGRPEVPQVFASGFGARCLTLSPLDDAVCRRSRKGCRWPDGIMGRSKVRF